MKQFLERVTEYRNTILVFLIFILLVISFASYFDDIDDDIFLLNSKTIISLLIIIVAFVFLDKLNLYQFLANKLEFIQEISPAQYIFYDFNSKEITIPKIARALLNIDKKEKYELSDISKLFPLVEWDEISKYLDDPITYLNIEKIGTINCHITKEDSFYLKYSIQSVRDSKYGIYGIIFWFVDFTQSRFAEIELMSLLNKYREMSFDLDIIFDHIPIPLWKSNRENKLQIYNRAFAKILDNSDNALIESIKNNKKESFVKKILIKNKPVSYKFQEFWIDNTDEKIGYAIDISNTKDLQNTIGHLQSAIDMILEVSSNAILVIDSKMNIIKFNSAFVNLFDLDRKWLLQEQSYSTLLDKLKEKGKLTESPDYKEYKKQHVEFIKNLDQTHHTLSHLPDGRSLRVSTVPTELGDTIIIYDNISDILKVERSYNELMDSFKFLISELESAICIIDHTGKIKLFNKTFSKLLFGNEKVLIGMDFLDTLAQSNNSVISNNIDIIKEEPSSKDDLFISYERKTIRLNKKLLPDHGILLIFNE